MTRSAATARTPTGGTHAGQGGADSARRWRQPRRQRRSARRSLHERNRLEHLSPHRRRDDLSARTSRSELTAHQARASLEPLPWVGAAAVARYLGVDVSYVYEHADELGAHRLGNGPKARLRFRLDLVDRVLSPARAPNETESSHNGTRRRRRYGGSSSRSVPLLPIRSQHRS
jgi:hypothetical protein